MKKILFFLSVAALAACQPEDRSSVLPQDESAQAASRQQPAAAEIGLVDAYLVDELISDGCALHLRVGDAANPSVLVASEASQRKVSNYFKAEGRGRSVVPVKIAYVPTGTQRTLACGWGQSRTYPAVDVVVLK